MSTSSPAWTDVLQTIFVGLQLVVLVAAALFARSQVAVARDLREDQARPFVVIDLDSPRKPFFYLVVKNIGTTMARDIRFEFDPPLQSTISHASLNRLKMFREGISTLPPDKEIRTFFDDSTKRYKADLPDVSVVKVAYLDQTGTKRFEESIDLDFGLYWNRLSVTEYGVHDVYKQLDSIRSEITKWTANPGGGILRATPHDMDERARHLQEEMDNLWWKPEKSDPPPEPGAS